MMVTSLLSMILLVVETVVLMKEVGVMNGMIANEQTPQTIFQSFCIDIKK